MFEEGNNLEKIERDCFKDSRLEKMALPKTLVYIGYNVFENCKNLGTIYVEDGCEADLFSTGMQHPT